MLLGISHPLVESWHGGEGTPAVGIGKAVVPKRAELHWYLYDTASPSLFPSLGGLRQ